MPGNELIGNQEYKEVKKVFKKSGGVLYAHGFDKRRNQIFHIPILFQVILTSL